MTPVSDPPGPAHAPLADYGYAKGQFADDFAALCTEYSLDPAVVRPARVLSMHYGGAFVVVDDGDPARAGEVREVVGDGPAFDAHSSAHQRSAMGSQTGVTVQLHGSP